jgi:hypothetical protein
MTKPSNAALVAAAIAATFLAVNSERPMRLETCEILTFPKGKLRYCTELDPKPMLTPKSNREPPSKALEMALQRITARNAAFAIKIASPGHRLKSI